MAGHDRKRKMEVKSANLLVRIKYLHREKHRKGAKGKLISLEISTVGVDGKVREVIATLRSEIKKTTWLKLTLPHSLVQNFIESGQKTFWFHVKCQGCRKGTKVVLVHGGRKRKRRRLRISAHKKKRRLNKRRPFLILHTRVETLIRNKRSANECPTSGVVSRCCKSSILVNFEDIGWGDWIISPRQFTTVECYGRCRSVSYNESVVSERECIPTRTKSLRLAYLNDNGYLIYTVLPKMVVANCGCR